MNDENKPDEPQTEPPGLAALLERLRKATNEIQSDRTELQLHKDWLKGFEPPWNPKVLAKIQRMEEQLLEDIAALEREYDLLDVAVRGKTGYGD
jgi:hypothetical protein